VSSAKSVVCVAVEAAASKAEKSTEQSGWWKRLKASWAQRSLQYVTSQHGLVMGDVTGPLHVEQRDVDPTTLASVRSTMTVVPFWMGVVAMTPSTSSISSPAVFRIVLRAAVQFWDTAANSVFMPASSLSSLSKNSGWIQGYGVGYTPPFESVLCICSFFRSPVSSLLCRIATLCACQFSAFSTTIFGKLLDRKMPL